MPKKLERCVKEVSKKKWKSAAYAICKTSLKLNKKQLWKKKVKKNK